MTDTTPTTARELLVAMLTEHGPMPASEALGRLGELGLSEYQARRAKAAEGVTSARPRGIWTWTLPAVPCCPTCRRPFADDAPKEADMASPAPPSPEPAPSPPEPAPPSPPPDDDALVLCSVCDKAAIGLPLGWPCIDRTCRGRYR